MKQIGGENVQEETIQEKDETAAEAARPQASASKARRFYASRSRIDPNKARGELLGAAGLVARQARLYEA